MGTAHPTGLAATGIGSDDPLETAVTTLAAGNTTSGNLQVVNNAGSELVIGTVGAVIGIQNAGGGFVSVTNADALTVNNNVTNVGGGDIYLTSLGNGAPGHNLTVNTTIAATGGNGSILLNAGSDLVINDSGSAIDLATQNGGLISGFAQGQVVIGSNVVLETGAGSITTLSPALDNVTATPISVNGVTHLSGTFGDPGAHNFTIVVNWGDGSSETLHFDDPGAFDLTHTYASNLAAPIVIVVTVTGDPQIQLIGLQQPPVTFPLSPTETKTVGNGFASVATMMSSPVAPQLPPTLATFQSFELGSTSFGNGTSPHIPLPLYPVLVPLSYVIDSPTVGQSHADLESSVVVRITTDSELRHEVVDGEGKIVREQAVQPKALQDLPGLYRSLPDGRHRFLIQQPGQNQWQLLIDVNIREGKPVGNPQGSRAPSPSGPSSGTSEPAAFIDGRDERQTDENGPSAIEHNVVRSISEAPFQTEVIGRHATPPIVLSAALLAGIARSTGQSGHAWSARVDAALNDAQPQSLTKEARLRRRLRKWIVGR